MTITIKAKYANGHLTPLEPLDLEEGAEVTVSVEPGPALAAGEESLLDMFDRIHQSTPPGTWDNLPTDTAKERREQEGPLLRVLRKAQERQAELPPETWDNIPTDLAVNKKHYLYGHPKEED